MPSPGRRQLIPALVTPLSPWPSPVSVSEPEVQPECPHLAPNNVSATAVRQGLKEFAKPRDVKCEVCQTHSDSLWTCLCCGKTFCGRYEKGHGIVHHKETGHVANINPNDLSTFCYLCDDYISSHDDLLDPIRSIIRDSLHLSQDDDETLSDASLTSEFLMSIEDEGSSLPKRELPIDRKKELLGGHMGAKRDRSRKKRRVEAITWRGVTGLTNLGNTCFMNSILQALSATELLKDYFSKYTPPPSISAPPTQPPTQPASTSQSPQSASPTSQQPRPLTRRMTHFGGVSLSSEFAALIKDMWASESHSLTPESFLQSVWKVVPMFKGYQQQDAQEFLRYLLDRLHNELSSNDDGIMTKTFRGILWNQVTCLRCMRVSSKEDPFLDMSLTIPERFVARRNKLEQNLNPCTIYDCLQAFTELETLAESERYRCDFCKDMERITKKFLIKRLPEVLCLHVKRFRYSRSARAKIDTYVQFPLVGLDMAPFTGENVKNTVYDLYSAVVHHGQLGSGHYISYVYNPDADAWFEMNDSSVQLTTPEFVATQNVYVLFYERRRKKPGPVPSPANASLWDGVDLGSYDDILEEAGASLKKQ